MSYEYVGVMCFLPSFSTLEVVLWLVSNSKTTTRPLCDFVDDVDEFDSWVPVLVSAMMVALCCVSWIATVWGG